MRDLKGSTAYNSDPDTARVAKRSLYHYRANMRQREKKSGNNMAQMPLR